MNNGTYNSAERENRSAGPREMKTSLPTRRQFLGGAGVLGAAGVMGGAPDRNARLPRYRLGIVTYNIAANWDLSTILRICRNVGLSPVELRTTHKHGVEPTLSKGERKEV